MRIVRKNSEIRWRDAEEPEGKTCEECHHRPGTKLERTQELIRKAGNVTIVENENSDQKEMKKETKRTRGKGTSLERKENSNVYMTEVHKEGNQRKDTKQVVKSIIQNIIQKKFLS